MQYICLVGYRLPPLDGYVSVCLVLTVEVYASMNLLTSLIILLGSRIDKAQKLGYLTAIDKNGPAFSVG